jgi:hypothetical protein
VHSQQSPLAIEKALLRQRVAEHEAAVLDEHTSTDGSCQFDAIRRMLIREGVAMPANMPANPSTLQIREAVCDFMVAHRADFQLGGTDQQFNGFLLSMRRPREWAIDDRTLVAAARLFNVHFRVVSSRSNQPESRLHSHADVPEGARELLIAHHVDLHFYATRRHDAVDPPALTVLNSGSVDDLSSALSELSVSSTHVTDLVQLASRTFPNRILMALKATPQSIAAAEAQYRELMQSFRGKDGGGACPKYDPLVVQGYVNQRYPQAAYMLSNVLRAARKYVAEGMKEQDTHIMHNECGKVKLTTLGVVGAQQTKLVRAPGMSARNKTVSSAQCIEFTQHLDRILISSAPLRVVILGCACAPELLGLYHAMVVQRYSLDHVPEPGSAIWERSIEVFGFDRLAEWGPSFRATVDTLGSELGMFVKASFDTPDMTVVSECAPLFDKRLGAAPVPLLITASFVISENSKDDMMSASFNRLLSHCAVGSVAVLQDRSIKGLVAMAGCLLWAGFTLGFEEEYTKSTSSGLMRSLLAQDYIKHQAEHDGEKDGGFYVMVFVKLQLQAN